MPYLAFNLNDGNEFVFDILEERLTIGRDSKNDIVIDNTYISGFHAEFIRQADGVYELVDLKSSNGTFVNGKRIERARLKGGDKVRFGQLDSRFRERNPKGMAPAGGAKAAAASKNEPARADGKRGDTEAVPAREPGEAPLHATPQTSPVEPTRAPLPRPGEISAGAGSTAGVDLNQQVEAMNQELARLKREGDRLRAENAREAKKKEELLALEKRAEEASKNLTENSAKLALLQGTLKTAEAEKQRLEASRREAGNLHSQVESSRSELGKVQADISVAVKSLESLHKEADRLNAERAAQIRDKDVVAEELAALKSQLADAQESMGEAKAALPLNASAAPAEVQADEEALKAVTADLARRREELELVQKTVENLRQEETQRAANIRALGSKESGLGQVTRALAEMESKRSLLEAALAGLTNQQSTAEAKLGELNQQCEEASGRLRDLSSERTQAVSEHQALNVTKLQLENQIKDLRRHSEHLVSSHKKAEEETRLKLEALEEKARLKGEEVQALEARSSDLAGSGTELRDASEALAEAETRKQELAEEVGKLSQERDDLTRTLLAAVEKGKAQHGLTEQLETRRESVEKNIRELEDQKEAFAAATGKVKEALAEAESSLKECNESVAAAEQKAQELTTAADAASLRRDTAQKEALGLEEQIKNHKAEHAQSAAELEESKKAATLAGQELAEATQRLAALKTEITEAENRRQTLAEENAEAEKRVTALRTETDRLQGEMAARLKELTESEVKTLALREEVAALQNSAKDLTTVQADLELARQNLVRTNDDQEKLSELVTSLVLQREDYEQTLPGLRNETEAAKTTLTTLVRDKEQTEASLEKAQADRNAALHETEKLRAESAALERLLTENRSSLETETRTKVAEAEAAVARLGELQGKIATCEKRAAELAEIESRLDTALERVREAEKRRVNEEKALAELAQQQEAHRKEVARLENEARGFNGRLAELVSKASFEETRAQDAEDRLQKAGAALRDSEARRLEAEAQITRVREEEKGLRLQIPGLHTEMAGLQAMLTSLTKEREEASQFVTRLNVTTENSNKKLGDLQQHISQLEEAVQIREQRLVNAQAEVDKESARLKAAQETTRAAEQALQNLEKQVKEARQRADAAQGQSKNLENELSTRLDRVEALKMEESRLNKELESQQASLQGAAAQLSSLQGNIKAEDDRLAGYLQHGGNILALGEALHSLEGRQKEAAKALREASEQELALQVKLSTLQESVSRESARAEAVRKERAGFESELLAFTAKAEKQAQELADFEAARRKQLAGLEQQIRDQQAEGEKLEAELSGLHDRRTEFAQLETQLKHWKEIENRMRSQLIELEEKHELMRRGLPVEEMVVVMFANDIIKRIDLIDALSSRYHGYNGGDVVTQLRTLRHSFEDILLQHGISEFDIGHGTEVDVELRRRITVVESVAGKNKPRVVETCRSGFVYSREEGHELILRKVEVRTSSQ